MFRKVTPAAGSLALALLLAAPAAAQELVDASDPEQLADLFRGYGSARMDVAADGTPAIRGRIEGIAYSVYFYGCDDSDVNCTTLNVTASWDTSGATTVESVNAWNAAKRFGRGYLDSSGNPALDMDINLSGSVTMANMESNIDWWRIVMKDFKENVVDAPAPEAEAEAEATGGGLGTAAEAGAGETASSEARGPFAVPRKSN